MYLTWSRHKLVLYIWRIYNKLNSCQDQNNMTSQLKNADKEWLHKVLVNFLAFATLMPKSMQCLCL